MKRIIFTSLLFFISMTNAMANGYCDARPSQRERANCYQASVAMAQVILDSTLQKFYDSPQIPPHVRKTIERDHEIWANHVNITCRNNSCIEASMKDRNLSLTLKWTEFQKKHKQ